MFIFKWIWQIVLLCILIVHAYTHFVWVLLLKWIRQQHLNLLCVNTDWFFHLDFQSLQPQLLSWVSPRKCVSNKMSLIQSNESYVVLLFLTWQYLDFLLNILDFPSTLLDFWLQMTHKRVTLGGHVLLLAWVLLIWTSSVTFARGARHVTSGLYS